MHTKMQFQKNANVIAADGQSVGQVDRIVVNSENNVVTHLVVHKGGLFNHEDKLVPIELVSDTNSHEVILRDGAGELKHLRPFEEEHIVEDEDNSPSTVGSDPILYGSPALAMPIAPETGENFKTRVDQNIPEGTVAMKEGAKVITADGKNVGNVERVFTDLPEEQITHLLISHGLFTKKTKLVPAEWLESVNEDQVNLRVHKTSVDALADTSVFS